MKTRQYTMSSRADSTVQTGERILEAVTRRYAVTPYDRLRLDDIANDAGVSVQTVIRRFGGKSGLVCAAVERGLDQIGRDRRAQSGARPSALLHDLVGYYESGYGDLILKVYAEAPQVEGLAPIADAGRRFHVDWVRASFDPYVARSPEDVHRRRLAQLVMLCDATTWRILRRDGGLSAVEVERALSELIAPLMKAPMGE